MSLFFSSDINLLCYPGFSPHLSAERERMDRMAPGSGSISDELSKGQVFTACGIDVTLLRSSRDRNHWAHWLRGSWFNSIVVFFPCFSWFWSMLSKRKQAPTYTVCLLIFEVEEISSWSLQVLCTGSSLWWIWFYFRCAYCIEDQMLTVALMRAHVLLSWKQ